MSERPRLGVLALQGDFAAHEQALERAAAATGRTVDVRRVRRPAHLDGLDGLVLPGGESTTLLKLLALEGLDEAIAAFVGQGRAVLATCAGVIVLAREVRAPAQRSLGLLDVAVERNSYGRQVDSFIASFDPPGEWMLRPDGEDAPLEGVFIRAPRILSVGPTVEVLARHGDDPVLVQQDRVLGATYHPELTSDVRVHAHWIDLACGAALARAS